MNSSCESRQGGCGKRNEKYLVVLHILNIIVIHFLPVNSWNADNEVSEVTADVEGD